MGVLDVTRDSSKTRMCFESTGRIKEIHWSCEEELDWLSLEVNSRQEKVSSVFEPLGDGKHIYVFQMDLSPLMYHNTTICVAPICTLFLPTVKPTTIIICPYIIVL